MLTDLEIAQAATLRPITDVAEGMGLQSDELEMYGHYKAKVHLEVRDRLADRPQGKYVLVTAITPTPLGEGKTVTTIGLAQGLQYVGKQAICTLRQPSMGPVFGIKGGAAGGGYAQVVPMEDLNLHFTGDIHAVGAANNLLAAMIDASLWHGNPEDLDPQSLSWNRVVDMNDVALRHIVTGLGGAKGGVPREAQFDIAVASEIMAILALTTSLQDLRHRLGRIQIGLNRAGKPVTAENLGAAGAMAVLMKDALMPNLMQRLDGGPAFVHAGPFANIAIGCNSIVADQIALKLGEYVVTEAGFGADIGAEKFMDIKCRAAGLAPNAVVIVATVKALKMHGGAFQQKPGKKPPMEEIMKPNPAATEKGAQNLSQHIENLRKFGVPVVVALNAFPYDTPEETEIVRAAALSAGAEAAVESLVHSQGGEGGAALAEAVIAAADKPSELKFLYPLEAPIKEKIETIAREIYRAGEVQYSPVAEKKIKQFTKQGLDKLPICMAKTHLSFTHDPDVKNVAPGFTLPIRDIRPSVGAGFLYPLCGEMSTMPALPTRPAAVDVDLDDNGNIVGLF
ncbi:MAG: formate--tetrahydrofolate ligase [candidate division WS1 bacterium]|jgi:formate--tetrahydrofolate ligase|nr:formate--tetrahydrofolate ligase [candidate division WS1 bacterium]